MVFIESLKEWKVQQRRKRTVKQLEAEIEDRTAHIDEMMDLKEVTDVYSEYVCKMNGWDTKWMGELSKVFCEIGFAFMSGYNKALHDNGFKFVRGLVKKTDITEEMPHGALKYYRDDAIKETKNLAVEKLRKVMEQYETSKANIATIVRAFEKELED